MDTSSDKLREMLKEQLVDLHLKDIDSVCDIIMLDYGDDVQQLHKAQIYSVAMDACKIPLGSESHDGRLTWRIDTLHGLPNVFIDFHIDGETTRVPTSIPFGADNVARDFHMATASNEASKAANYLKYDVTDTQRDVIWADVADDCRSFEANLDDAERIYSSDQWPVLLRDAASKGHLDAVNCALDMGVDVNAASAFGNTALHLAASGGHDHLIESLVQSGALTNAENGASRTPLHLAARNSYPSTCLALMAQGADPALTDVYGLTAMDLAKGDGKERSHEQSL